MSSERPDNPGVIVLPPLLFGGALLVGLVAHWLVPVWPLPLVPARVAGAVLVVLAGAIGLWGEHAMRRAGTNIRPDKPALAIVVDGPFRWSRNPLYLALTALYSGVSLLFDALWPLVLLVPVWLALHFGVVLREERYLAAKFGEPYLAYQRRVRRYI